MNTYLIKGADKTTGKDRNFTIKAIDQEHAEAAIARDGVLISETLIQSDNGDRFEKIVPEPPETDLATNVRHILFWVRFWSVIGIIGLIFTIIAACSH